MANTLSAVVGTNNVQTAGATGTASTDKLANKDTFLQLMVAQLRYQNPLNPVDGSTFLAQLSQISGVEQMVQMGQDLGSIKQLLTPVTPSAGTQSSESAPDSGSSIRS